MGVLAGPFSPFHDSRIVLESVCTLDTLDQLRWKYQIPDSISLSLPYRGYEVYAPPEGRLLIHKAAFECGVHLLFHPSLCRTLVALELAPLQLSTRF